MNELMPSLFPPAVARNPIESDASIDSAGPDTDCEFTSHMATKGINRLMFVRRFFPFTFSVRRNPTEGSNVPVTPKKVHSKRKQPAIDRSAVHLILSPSLSAVRSYPVARGDKGPQKTKHCGFSLSTCVPYLS